MIRESKKIIKVTLLIYKSNKINNNKLITMPLLEQVLILFHSNGEVIAK